MIEIGEITEITEGLTPISVAGRTISVKVLRAQIRNCYARVRGDFLVIKVPERMSGRSAGKAATELYRRMSNALQKDPGRFLGMPEINFNDKDTLYILDNKLSVNILRTDAERIKISTFNGSIYVTAPISASSARINLRIRRFIEKTYLPDLCRMVHAINEKHFCSTIGTITLRDNLTTWGSCSRDNNIILNFRLLHAPQHILEYVAVHELAHTKIRNHSKRFWQTVSSVIPDYKERRRWLRTNSQFLKPLPAS